MSGSDSTLFWIIGRGGLLGARLPAALETHVPNAACWDPPVLRFSWGSPLKLAGQLDDSAAAFAADIRRRGCRWGVLWSAGAGVIGTGEDALAAETATLEALLASLGSHLSEAPRPPGLVFLASSAGGIYGNCTDPLITELSDGRPISAYGRNKQRQEDVLNRWADRHPEVTCRIGRISNIYGPGQNLAKPQGLISHVSRCLIWQRPIHIYVPLDTIRDYIYVDDCARQVACCAAEWLGTDTARGRSSRERIKLFVAEKPTTVAQIVGEFKRLSLRRQPRVICAPSSLGLQQPRCLQFRSGVFPSVSHLAATALQVGISHVHEHHMAMYREGRLAAPVMRA